VDEARQHGDGGRGDDLSARAGSAAPDAESAPEPLPDSLRQRLDRCADDWLHECATRRCAASRVPRFSTSAPWFAAAVVASLLLVVAWPRLTELGAAASRAGGLAQWQAQRGRAAMMQSPGVEHWAWGGAAEHGAGDVVWDPRQQRGYLRLRGYVPNDPAQSQYQAWIFDAARDDRYPVDGGVFDVPAGADELIVPIQASVPVERAEAFAVTVEQPGGTVVSDRAKLVAFARAGD